MSVARQIQGAPPRLPDCTGPVGVGQPDIPQLALAEGRQPLAKPPALTVAAPTRNNADTMRIEIYAPAVRVARNSTMRLHVVPPSADTSPRHRNDAGVISEKLQRILLPSGSSPS